MLDSGNLSKVLLNIPQENIKLNFEFGRSHNASIMSFRIYQNITRSMEEVGFETLL